ncbi:hypothetical protein [Fusobacterium polymorphum]|uniref:hypothetical protein n=1 Tax=Fusobacterium nucleatum subsp. polymorphum TaxID=76857 RepID=UPI000C1B3B00|nr:hypothetical protein [Fusobacterium polymorphum]PIM75763.1 hypothetical protein CTM65_07145 [Fusobacterium polymorphum]
MIEYMKKLDKGDLFKFLEENWNINHIYLKDKKYFNYEFSDNSNFILAKNNDRIVATLGYFDYDNKGDIWTVIWKNSGKMDDGLKCLQFLLNADYKSVSSCGINKKTIPIYEFLGIKTGRLKHFYILNPEIKDYKIAKISEKNIKKIDYKNVKDIIEVKNIEELLKLIDYQELKKYNFYKSPEYFNKRYFKHPYYKYHILVKSKVTNSILVYRIVKENGGSCIRIIDFLGEEKEFNELTNYLIDKMLKEKHEYVDIYEVGIEDEILENSGFLERVEKDVNIIPNYFEPFVQENIEIYYMSNCKDKFRMFKGDGDQDRPSIVKEKKDEE